MTLRCPDKELHLWVLRPDRVEDPEVLEWCRGLLAPEERRRYEAFVFDRHRHEYLMTRALVRTTLSRYGGIAPKDWRFVANAHGRPELAPDLLTPVGSSLSSLSFNLSNCLSLVVCLVSERHEIGVDVEPLARADHILEVADTVFSDEELMELRALDAPRARDRAVSLWTLKEAYIKARGMGLSLPLDQITMRFEPSLSLHTTAAVDRAPEAWSMRTMDFQGHRMAFASRDPRRDANEGRDPPEIKLFVISSDPRIGDTYT